MSRAVNVRHGEPAISGLLCQRLIKKFWRKPHPVFCLNFSACLLKRYWQGGEVDVEKERGITAVTSDLVSVLLRNHLCQDNKLAYSIYTFYIHLYLYPFYIDLLFPSLYGPHSHNFNNSNYSIH